MIYDCPHCQEVRYSNKGLKQHLEEQHDTN